MDYQSLEYRIYTNGTQQYRLNGSLHRDDGPAITRPDGSNEYFLNGECLTEEQFKARRYPKAGTKVTVDGVEYTLTPP